MLNDEVLKAEKETEALWKLQKGVDPKTGKLWLTPRMERNAKELVSVWDKQDKMKKINGFDCDGVITIGIYPGPEDVIITGRSFEEKEETMEFLTSRGIYNIVHLSPHKFADKTRVLSGIHKGETILSLYKQGITISVFFEDDPVQYHEIKRLVAIHKLPTKLVWVDHDGLIGLENKRHHDNLPQI